MVFSNLHSVLDNPNETSSTLFMVPMYITSTSHKRCHITGKMTIVQQKEVEYYTIYLPSLPPSLPSKLFMWLKVSMPKERLIPPPTPFRKKYASHDHKFFKCHAPSPFLNRRVSMFHQDLAMGLKLRPSFFENHIFIPDPWPY